MRTRTRRQVLRSGAGLTAGALAWAVAGCAGPVRTTPSRAFLRTPPAPQASRVVLGWHGSSDMRAVAQRTVERIGGLSWLRPGDKVFVKVACNSGNEHPAVTSPAAVRAVVGLLRDAGASTVFAGDQSGVEHVRLTASGRVSSTATLMAGNGLRYAIVESGARLHNFDDQSYDATFAPPDDFRNHWDGALRLPNVLREVDHVVNLTRLGSHVLSGYTAAVKNAVGWLRDDSRRHLHSRGDTFFEQLAEISSFSPLRDKLRLSLSLGSHALLGLGPDFGAVYDFEGTVAIASSGLLEHDALATAVLLWLDQSDRSIFDIYEGYPEDADFWNRGLVRDTWGREALQQYRELVTYRLGKSLAYDRCLAHVAVLRGERPTRIVIDRDGDRIPDELVRYLRTYGDGLFAG